MKSLLASAGLGALICLPCLVLFVGGIGVVAGGTVAAAALHSLTQALAAAAASAALADVVWYVRRRWSCAQATSSVRAA